MVLLNKTECNLINGQKTINKAIDGNERKRIMARNWSGHTKPPLGYGHKK